MRIFVNAKPNSHEEKIEKIDETHFSISVKEPPIKGMANHAIEKVLSEYFNMPLSNIRLISGFSSRQKTFEIQLP